MTNKKIKTPKQLEKILKALKAKKKCIVFTNGCFDLLHPGHISYLEDAKKKGDLLVVALNTDASIRKIKGKNRPITDLRGRLKILAALESVDFVTFFSEVTPEKIIKHLKPNLIVKGSDWKLSKIVGADFVKTYGGKAITMKFQKGHSTTNIIKKIAERFNQKKDF